MGWQAILYLSILILGILIGVLKYKRLSIPGKSMFFFITYIFLKEFSALLIGRYWGYNLNYYKYLSVVDFVFIMFIFFKIPILKPLKHIFLTIVLVGVLFYLLNLAFWQPAGRGIDSNFKLVRSVLFIISSLILFFCITKNVDQKSIFKSSEFWFSSALLIYYLISMFYWGLFNYNLVNKDVIMKQVLRPLFEFSNYIFYGLIIFSVFLDNFFKKEI